jgi:hypothetical protein
MTQDLPSGPQKPRLDDLLTAIGITREQLGSMTADDLFAAATQWQNEVAMAADANSGASPVDDLLDSLQEQSVERQLY